MSTSTTSTLPNTPTTTQEVNKKNINEGLEGTTDENKESTKKVKETETPPKSDVTSIPQKEIEYNLSNLKDILSQQDLLKKHLNELKKSNINSIYNENKMYIDYFHEKYNTDIYGDNSSDMELLNLKKKNFTYLKSLETIEDYNKPLLNVIKEYDNNKKEEEQKIEQKYNTLSYGLCNDVDNKIDPREYLRKNVFNVLMPGIKELLS